MFEALTKMGFQMLMLHHAQAILQHDMASAVLELEDVRAQIAIPVHELVRGGGGEGALTQRMRKALAEGYGWRKHRFEIKKVVDGEEKESISHEIDHVKRFATGTIALEIEWNNKDPFFDRDLENFKRLHADGVISVGVIITRSAALQNALRGILADFARKTGMNDTETLKKYYSPTSRQLALIHKAARAQGSFEEG